MTTNRKLVLLENLHEWRGGRCGVVLTNGVYDLLHPGHIHNLSAARAMGSCLVVAVNSDASVCQLKGPLRPVIAETDRAYMLEALSVVDAVCIVDDLNMVRVIQTLRPDVWVKGGDYSLETINAHEREAAEAVGARVEIVEFYRDWSTSSLRNRLLGLTEAWGGGPPVRELHSVGR